jgi:hypothetical protein
MALNLSANIKYMKNFLAFLCLLLTTNLLTAQNAETAFGKNRVQFHDDFEQWSLYESDNFVTYWYGKSRNVGRMVAQIAEYDFKEIQNILEHHINNKVEIIVYTDITDLKQSNIGSEKVFTNKTGQTKILGNKIFVYFNGDHNQLREQVREGIASVYLEAMLFGSTIQEVVQNAIALNLSEWFKQGLVAFVAKGWNSDLDNQLRDVILSEDFEGFEDFSEKNPRLAGHALWYYINANYGQSTLSNLLYLTRINRSEAEGFRAVLGTPYAFVLKKWEDYFTLRYTEDQKARQVFSNQEITIKNKRNLPVYSVKISPDGKKIAYVQNEIGKYKVYIQDIQTGDRKVILKGGFRNAFQATDYNYPLIKWNPNAQELGIIHEKRDIAYFLSYNTETKKNKEEPIAPGYQRIYSMDFVNPFMLVLSASTDGYSDIFLYNIKSRQSDRITRDFYDDLDAVFTKTDNKRGILFVSNRPDSTMQYIRHDTILPLNTFDVFYYDLEKRSQELVRVTNTPLVNERQPLPIDTKWFTYLTNQNGIQNRAAGYLEEYIHHYEQVITFNDGSEITLHADSVLAEIDSTTIDTIAIFPVIKKRGVSHFNTNYARNIVQQDVSPRVNKLIEKVLLNDKTRVFIQPINTAETYNPANSYFQSTAAQSKNSVGAISTQQPAKTVLDIVEEVPVKEAPQTPEKGKEEKIDIDNYLFQSEFDEEEAPVEEKKETPKTKKDTQKEETVPTIVYVNGKLAGTKRSTSAYQKRTIHKIRPGKIKPYRPQFRTDYVTTQLDNKLLFEGLESYGANPDGFNYPPTGLLLKANFKDLLEDYQFDLGVRVPTSFNGTEYFVVFNDKKKRFDKQYAVYRKNIRLPDESASINVPAKRQYNILLGQFRLSYPLDIFHSLRGTVMLRKDRSLYYASEQPTLNREILNEQRASIKLEYVFDNTLDVAINIKNGTRYKVYAEMIKRFNVDVDSGVKIGLSDGFMTVLGLDFRHYQRIDKRSILALRLAGATSFGAEKILFIMGGTDGELINVFNNNIPIPPNESFVYQTPATNIRGFSHNIRNGNSYLLANAELRVPIVQYISQKVRSPFLRNFQVIGFFDVGTAWTGKDPLSDENPLNISYFPENPTTEPVIVRVKYYRDPIVAGYGVGLRSVIFGHFLRFDYAWGLETKAQLKPKYHLSMGVDF